jgi:hypothetical protein
VDFGEADRVAGGHFECERDEETEDEVVQEGGAA